MFIPFLKLKFFITDLNAVIHLFDISQNSLYRVYGFERCGMVSDYLSKGVDMIVYGSITDTSIGQLFMAGIVPGLLLTGLLFWLI